MCGMSELVFLHGTTAANPSIHPGGIQESDAQTASAVRRRSGSYYDSFANGGTLHPLSKKMHKISPEEPSHFI